MLLKSLLIVSIFCYGNLLFAGELDNEKNVIEQAKKTLAKDLPAMVVVRINETTQNVEVFHSDSFIPKEESLSFAKTHGDVFKPLTEKQKRGELDSDSSRSSWFFGLRWGFGHDRDNGRGYHGGGYSGGRYNGGYYNAYPNYYYPNYNYYGYNYQYLNYSYSYCGGYGYYYYRNPYWY